MSRLKQLVPAQWSTWVHLGFVFILVGYFLPWFKLDAAGLTLIGIDISEWLKFMPQFATGEMVAPAGSEGLCVTPTGGELPNRNYFYLPPLTLGGMVVMWSIVGAGRGVRGWLVAAVGCAIALLAMPAFEALPLNLERFCQFSEWRFRLISIGLVMALTAARPLLGRLQPDYHIIAITLLALTGAVFPSWLLYLSRSAYIFWLRLTPDPGLGFWLHLVGTLLILIGCWRFFFIESENRQ